MISKDIYIFCKKKVYFWSNKYYNFLKKDKYYYAKR